MFHLLFLVQSTSNYHARRYGVRAAMPGFIGKKLCPQLVIVPTHFDKYRAVSHQVRQILAEYDPNYCPMSLDEAYFDLTDYLVRRQEMGEEERTYPYRVEEVSIRESKSSTELSKMPDQDRAEEDAKEGGIDHLGENMSNLKAQEPEMLSSPSKEAIRPCKESCTAACRQCEDPKSELDHDGDETAPDEKCKGCRERRRMFGVSCEEVVEEIRFRIEQKTQLTASAGKLMILVSVEMPLCIPKECMVWLYGL